MLKTSDLVKSINFLTKIGISIQITTNRINSFLPGVWVDNEVLWINPIDSSISNIFHEAGHVAVTPSEFRKYLKSGDFSSIFKYYDEYLNSDLCFDTSGNETPLYRAIFQSSETEAIAWSYAAVIAAGIEPYKVFEKGFEGSEEALYLGFKHNSDLGINGLHYGEMCDTNYSLL